MPRIALKVEMLNLPSSLTPEFEVGEKAPDADPIDVARVLAAVRRQAWVLAVGFATGWAIGIALAVTSVPTFTSTLDLMIDKGQGKLMNDFYLADSAYQDDADMLSRVELLKSDQISSAVATRLHLVENAEFMADTPSFVRATISRVTDLTAYLGGSTTTTRPRLGDIEDAVNILQRGLTVERIGRTYVLRLSYSSTSPQLAYEVARAFGEAYLDDQLQAKYDATKRASRWLQERIAELKQQSYEADFAVQKFRNENGLLIATTGGALVSQQQLSEINTQLVTAQANTSEAKAKFDQISGIIAEGRTDAVVGDALSNSNIVQLREKYLNAARNEAEISKAFGPNHMQAQRLRAQMEDYTRSIFSELSRIAESYKSDYTVALERQRSLERSLAEISGVNAGQNEVQVKLRELERESETLRSLYDNFLQRYQQAVQQQSFPISDVRVITPAVMPGAPSGPDKRLLIALSVGLGLMAGAGVGAVREYRDRFFRIGEQVRSELGLDFLGYLPKISRRAAADGNHAQSSLWRRESLADYVCEHALSSFAETLRNVKVATDIALPDQKCKVIGVVSGLPHEGKSTVAANLANLIALQGARVLLIDGDLRNPGLTRMLAERPAYGLLQAFVEQGALASSLIHDRSKKLSIFPFVIKRHLVNTSEILSSARFAAFLKGFRSMYDYVIIDLPPMGPVVDAKAFAHRVDGIVLVVEWGKTSRQFVRSILRSTPTIRGRCLGVVLNKTDTNKNKLYRSMGSAEYYATRYSSYYQN